MYSVSGGSRVINISLVALVIAVGAYILYTYNFGSSDAGREGVPIVTGQDSPKTGDLRKEDGLVPLVKEAASSPGEYQGRISYRDGLSSVIKDSDPGRRQDFIKQQLSDLNKPRVAEIFQVFIASDIPRDPGKIISGTILSEISSDKPLGWFYENLSGAYDREDVLANFASAVYYTDTPFAFDRLMAITELPLSEKMKERFRDGVLLTFSGTLTDKRIENIDRWLTSRGQLSDYQASIVSGLLKEAPAPVLKRFLEKDIPALTESIRTELKRKLPG